jgi:hypothetical protein
MITTFGTTMFEIMYNDQLTSSYTATITLNLISIIDPIANALSVVVIPLFNRKTSLLLGFTLAGLMNLAIGLSDVLEFKIGIIVFTMGLTLFVGIA